MSALERDLLSMETLSPTPAEPQQPSNTSAYARLDDPVNDIRLLEIVPKHTDDAEEHQRLECRLSVHTLNDQLSYMALSYVWGDLDDTRPITVNGHELQVTKNLAEALRQLRSDQIGPLWVDALCINQGDNDEKNHQVLRMSEIYKNALEVIAWLGPEKEGTKKTFEVIRELAELADSLQLPRHDEIKGTHLLQNMEITKDMCQRLLRESRFQEGDLGLVFSLTEETYWTRVWTIQELCLAVSAILQRGTSRIQWTDVMTAIKILVWLHILIMNIYNHTVDEGFQDELASLYKPFEPAKSVWPPAFYISSLSDGSGDSLGYLMRVTVDATKLECLNPRDRIYALLGLLWESHRADFPVDYSMSYEKLFIQATLSILSTTDGSRALLFAGLAYRNEGSEDDLPSWVVDWRCTRSRAEELFRYYDWSKPSAPSWKRIGDYEIAMKAAAGAEIKEVISSAKSLRDIVAFFEEVRRNHHLTREKARGLADYSLLSMIWRTWAYYFTHHSIDEKACVIFQRSLQSPDSESYPSAEELQELEAYKKQERIDTPRNLFITTEGSIGSGPPCTRPGDVVHAVEGVDVPLLLRPSHSHTNEDGKRWKLVGPAFVSDMITGDENDWMTLRDFWATEPEIQEVILV